MRRDHHLSRESNGEERAIPVAAEIVGELLCVRPSYEILPSIYQLLKEFVPGLRDIRVALITE